jgi:S-DNA-T family DNA segregation ATPase FtsK/SpoIIIE
LALTVASGTDSRTILDANGAEKLLGYGDMLFMPVGQSKPRRVQGCFVTNKEIERVIEFLKNADKPLEYDQEIIDEIEKQAAAAGRASSRSDAMEDEDGDDADEALPQAIELAIEAGQISTSMLQRKMRFGYARAGRIIDQMEQRGIIGPSAGSKPREVLITRQQWIEMNMNGDAE